MMRSFSLSLIFVSFSIWEPLIAGSRTDGAYGAAVTLSWALNLMVAEIWIRHPRWQASDHEAGKLCLRAVQRWGSDHLGADSSRRWKKNPLAGQTTATFESTVARRQVQRATRASIAIVMIPASPERQAISALFSPVVLIDNASQ